jgi:hypothetical protein
MFSNVVVTVVAFYFVSNRNEFVAIFATFMVWVLASFLFAAILLGARLIRGIKGRFSHDPRRT